MRARVPAERPGSGDALGHYCGVAGARAPSPVDLSQRLFYMLFALQHRGQESAGIATLLPDGRHLADRREGMVAEARERWLSGAPSAAGVGHVRYSTEGGSGLRNAQPLAVECTKGRIALAHNGNISNAAEIRAALSAEGAIFQTAADSELILHRISRSKAVGMEDVLRDALRPLEGAYSLALLWDDKLLAIRDPRGFRPLHVARKDGVWYVASETCALHPFGVEFEREVEPGECVVIDGNGMRSTRLFEPESALSRCVFELIYFARPDSRVFGRSVHEARRLLGAALAEDDNVEADVVVPVPDSGTLTAMGYAARRGLPFEFGLTRNHYAGRSFIMPTKADRELAVRMKLHPVREVLEGKRVVMIDDSLVRGTTSKAIVRLLKEAGAKEVHLRLASPELKWPCYYGIDIPTREELVSNRLDSEGIADFVGADSCRFLDIERLGEALGTEGWCKACFDGRHPCPVRGGAAGKCGVLDAAATGRT
ncbi:MAG: amidophosphoribosyltransferase [Spirochaetia bacterium]|nr:amidophosphoribosyltransferase [Spirochaetia bacterium]